MEADERFISNFVSLAVEADAAATRALRARHARAYVRALMVQREPVLAAALETMVRDAGLLSVA